MLEGDWRRIIWDARAERWWCTHCQIEAKRGEMTWDTLYIHCPECKAVRGKAID